MQKLLGIVGPSGVGKGFAKNQIRECFPGVFSEPIVATTRDKRPFPEPDRLAGIHPDEYQRMVENQEIVFSHQPFGPGTHHYGFLASSMQGTGNLITEVHIDNVAPFRDRYDGDLTLIGLVADEEYLKFNLDNRNSEKPEDKVLRLHAAQREIEQILHCHRTGQINSIVEATMINRDRVIQDILVGLVSKHLGI